MWCDAILENTTLLGIDLFYCQNFSISCLTRPTRYNEFEVFSAPRGFSRSSMAGKLYMRLLDMGISCMESVKFHDFYILNLSLTYFLKRRRAVLTRARGGDSNPVCFSSYLILHYEEVCIEIFYWKRLFSPYGIQENSDFYNLWSLKCRLYVTLHS